MNRWYGVLLTVLGAGVGVLPFAAWYQADLPGRTLRWRGVAVSGELWTVTLLGAVIVGIGVTVATRTPNPATPRGRWLGGASAVIGAMSVAWILLSIVRITSVAVPQGISGGPAVPLRAEPVAFVAAAAGAVVAAASLWWLRSGSD